MLGYKFRILFFLIILVKFSFSQKLGTINFDTSLCQNRSLNLKNDRVLKALAGAENYIKSIVGNQITQKNIWFDCFQSVENPIMDYSKDFKEYKYLGTDTCYQFYYYVLDKNKRIGEFILLVDQFGNLKKDEYDSRTNKPYLIKGFEKYFLKRFKFDYNYAIAVARKRGILSEPVLESDLENTFLRSQHNKDFVKVKYYWSFFQISNGGNEAILEINAETGKIENERYKPRMPN